MFWQNIAPFVPVPVDDPVPEPVVLLEVVLPVPVPVEPPVDGPVYALPVEVTCPVPVLLDPVFWPVLLAPPPSLLLTNPGGLLEEHAVAMQMDAPSAPQETQGIVRRLIMAPPETSRLAMAVAGHFTHGDRGRSSAGSANRHEGR